MATLRSPKPHAKDLDLTKAAWQGERIQFACVEHNGEYYYLMRDRDQKDDNAGVLLVLDELQWDALVAGVRDELNPPDE